jgi:hypothetical protein
MAAAAAGGSGGFEMGRNAAINAEKAGRERTLRDLFYTILPQFAVNDANHDFNKPNFDFSSIFNQDKNIGTPVNPDKIEDESHTLNTILQYFSTEGATYPEKFRNTFLIEGDNPFTFQRFAEDDIPYKVNAIHLGTTENNKGRVWKDSVSSSDLFDFLNPHQQTSIAFAVDSLTVPFYELLSRDKKGAQVSRNAYFIKSREELNDGASKITFEEPDITNLVTITTIDDKSQEEQQNASIVYNASVWKNDIPIHERELFYSKYNINLAPIKYNQNLLPLTTLKFSEGKFVRTVDVLRASKENSHPNAISSIIRQLRALFNTSVYGGIKTVANKLTYQTLLQQKRSGDWLQVLSCLNPERYGNKLDNGTRIFLVTHDRICLAYGLLMGIDVCYTTKKEVGGALEDWLVFFYKETNVEKISPSQRLLDKINTLPKPNEIAAQLHLNNNDGFTYESARNYYITMRDSTLSFYRDELIKSFDYEMSLFRRGIINTDKFNEHIRAVIKCAANIAVIRNAAPSLININEESIFQYKDIREIEEAGIENVVKLIDIYFNQFMTLKQSIFATETTALNYQDAIIRFFDKLKNKNKSTSKAYKQRAEIIDRIFIFKSKYTVGESFIEGSALFSLKNANINGMGIFNFLFQLLEQGEIKAITDHFDAVLKIMEGNVKAYNTFNTFVKVAKLELGLPVGGDVDVPNKDLLVTIGLLSSNRQDIMDDVGHKRKSGPENVKEYKRIRGNTAEVTDDAAFGENDRMEGMTPNPAISPQRGGEGGAAEAVGGGGGDVNDPISKEEEEDNKVLWNIEDTIHITDYFAAQLLLALRANQELNRGVAAAGGGGGVQRGGGKLPYKHNPLTTFYLLLREIGFRLTLEYEDKDILVLFSHFIYIILDTYNTVPVDYKKTYIKSAELYCTEYICNNPSFAYNKSYVEQLLLNFKKEYYGFYNVSQEYKLQFQSNAMLLETILLIDAKKESYNEENELDALRNRMDDIIRVVAESEKTPTKQIEGTRRNISKSKSLEKNTNRIHNMYRLTRKIKSTILPNFNKAPKAIGASAA